MISDKFFVNFRTTRLRLLAVKKIQYCATVFCNVTNEVVNNIKKIGTYRNRITDLSFFARPGPKIYHLDYKSA